MALTDSEKDFFSTLVADYAQKEVFFSFRKALDKVGKNAFVRNRLLREDDPSFTRLPVQADPEDGFLYRFDRSQRLGKSLLHALGAFYILDASSARFTWELSRLLPPRALVLDLCAAPGGKSISLKVRRPDVRLFANDISRPRALEMARNVERMGLCIPLLSLDPLSLDVPSLFDAVLLDAPCSGSGMVRKEEKMAKDWSRKKVESLLPIQEALIDKALSLLKDGGILAYATCSLSKEEDEDQVERLLRRNGDVQELALEERKEYCRGRHGVHLLPGTFEGEGFFFSFLRKKGRDAREAAEFKPKKKAPEEGYSLFTYRRQDYLVESMPSDLVHLDYLKPGIRIFDASDHPKFPYDHDYAKVTTKHPLLPLSEEEAVRYLRGEELRTNRNEGDGIYVLTYDNLRISFAKKDGSRIKNYLSKGLRQEVLPLGV